MHVLYVYTLENIKKYLPISTVCGKSAVFKQLLVSHFLPLSAIHYHQEKPPLPLQETAQPPLPLQRIVKSPPPARQTVLPPPPPLGRQGEGAEGWGLLILMHGHSLLSGPITPTKTTAAQTLGTRSCGLIAPQGALSLPSGSDVSCQPLTETWTVCREQGDCWEKEFWLCAEQKILQRERESCG